MDIKEKIENLNSSIEDAEGAIITFVTTMIPWLAPAMPAWLTYHHLVNMVNIPVLVAGAMALTVEFLGLSAVSTAFQAMRHNKTHKADKRKVSLRFPIIAYVFYILVILTVNIVMEIPMTEIQKTWAEIASIGLLTLISTPAFIIAIARQEQRQIDREYDSAKQGKVSTTAKNDSKPVNLSDMAVEDIMAIYNCSERTAYRKKEKARNNGHSKEKVEIS